MHDGDPAFNPAAVVHEQAACAEQQDPEPNLALQPDSGHHYMCPADRIDQLARRLVRILSATGCLNAADIAQRPPGTAERATASLASECALTCADRVMSDGLFHHCSFLPEEQEAHQSCMAEVASGNCDGGRCQLLLGRAAHMRFQRACYSTWLAHSAQF
eukprot:SAG31_NODE_13055_length_896_cov_0.920954_2_plen_159_part_01